MKRKHPDRGLFALPDPYTRCPATMPVEVYISSGYIGPLLGSRTRDIVLKLAGRILLFSESVIREAIRAVSRSHKQ